MEDRRSFLPVTKKGIYQYFLNTRQWQTQRPDLSLRKEIASVLGIGEETIARVVAE